MFFWLKCNGPAASTDWSEYLDELDNLGEAGFKNDHLILGDREVLQEILKVGLSRKAMAYFRSALSRYSTIAGLRSRIPAAHVSPDCHAAQQGADGWCIPLSSFNAHHSAARAHLVVEHMYDYSVLMALGQSEISGQGIASLVSLKFQPAAGGGGGTALTLRTIQQHVQHSIGLCVVDSDKGHVRDQLGATARRCIAEFVSEWNWALHVISARELENIIPPDFLAAAGMQDPVTFSERYANGYWAIYGYADLKCQDRLCRFFHLDSGSQSHAETQQALRALRGTALPGKDCIDRNTCKGDASCTLNTATSNLLATIAAWLSSPLNRFPRRFTTRVEALDELLSCLVTMGVASRWPMI